MLAIERQLYSTGFEFVVNYRMGQLQNLESSWVVQVKLQNFKIPSRYLQNKYFLACMTPVLTPLKL